MPKVIAYTLAWSPELQRYALFDGSTRLDIIPESPAWFDWLNQASSFGFIDEQGRYTLRKEKKQRGDAYWYAYYREGKQLAKKYVGKTNDLTLAHLEASILRCHTSNSPFAHGDEDAELLSTASRKPQRLDAEQEEKEQTDTSPETGQRFTQQSVGPLLATKLHIPRLPTTLVSRARLLKLLEQQIAGPLTFISAQAGSGKTTLLAEWVAQHKAAVAWVSLEADDNQPTRFFSYIIAALQKLDPTIGTTSLPPLKSLQPPELETILTLLTNEIAASRVQPVTLVLDDYHLITTGVIHNAITFLLDHLASHLHLILLTRSDPPLPLSRLRGRGQMLELRVADLRFDREETDQFLRTTLDRALIAEDVQLLEERTEGWIAGLQLASLSLRGQEDISAFVRAFAGSNRFVLDYLSDEIIAHLPAPTLAFLFHTCVLERLYAPLCAALLGEEMGISERESQEMLETLERSNLFVSALDDARRIYRYHALFASVLQAHLSKTDPALIPLLHQRACTWFEQYGSIHEAIHHAIAIQDVARITTLLQGIVWDMFLRGEFDVLLGWLERLPASLKNPQPALCFYHATALALLGQSDAAEAYLKQVEWAQQNQPQRGATSHVAVSSGEIAAIRTIIAVARGDLAQARAASQHALAELPESQVFLRSTIMGSEAVSAAIDGDFRNALQYLWQAGQISQGIDNPFTRQRGLFGLALFLTHLGQRSQVVATCEQAMHLAVTTKGSSLPFTGSISIFLGIALYENNMLVEARHWTQRGIELCEQLGETSFLPTAYALLAQILYLEEVKVRRSSSPSPEVLRIMRQSETLLRQQPPLLLWSRQHAAYILVRLWIAQHNREALSRLERFYPVDGEIGAAPEASYAAQTETWGLAYIRFGQSHPEETIAWLHWPIQAAEQAGRVLALTRMLILQALAYQELGQTAEAIGNIKRALQYAEPEGYITMFVEMGQPLVPLLLSFLEGTEVSRDVSLPFVQTLLRELDGSHETEQPSPPQSAIGANHSPKIAQEPLTEREMEVLRLIGVGLSNQAIASQMVVEVSTIKWHIRHIYEKLHAGNRTQALLQAQSRGLLP